MYGIKFNQQGEAIMFIERDGKTLEVVMDKAAVKKMIALLKAVEMDKLLGG